MSKQAVGDIFREWRECNGYTHDVACEVVGVSRSVLGQIENGHNYPSAETLAKFWMVSRDMVDFERILIEILEP